MTMNLFIQARMSSSRFPGKMLAPLNGKPLIDHITERISKLKNIDRFVVLTSIEPSDDPLACYLEQKGVDVFRGPLDNVYERFKVALAVYPCESFIRICGDSPIINTDLIDYMARLYLGVGCDFLSNVQHKKFPKGQSVEIINSDLFLRVDADVLTAEQREHVMPYFYENSAKLETYFPDSNADHRQINTCVDTIQDLKNIESGKITYIFDKEVLCENRI